MWYIYRRFREGVRRIAFSLRLSRVSRKSIPTDQESALTAVLQ